MGCRFAILDRSVSEDDKNTFFIRPEITIRPTAKLDLELTLQRLVEDGQH